MKKWIQFFLLFYLTTSVFTAGTMKAQESENIDFQVDEKNEAVMPKAFIDKNKWKKIAKKYDYRKERKLELEQKEENKTKQKAEKSEPLSPGMKNILTYTLFGIVILLLVFLGYRFIAGEKFFGNKKVKGLTVYALDDIENNLHEADINHYLNKAISSADYRVALRLYYLNLLKLLSANAAISWKREKTNGAYLLELSGHPIYGDFSKCTEIFEYFWFNETALINSEIFGKIRPFFEQTLSKIPYSKQSNNLKR